MKKLLTARFVQTSTKAGRYLDTVGPGLYLAIKAAGSKQGGSEKAVNKSWIQRITIRGKVAEMRLGSLKVVSLAQARKVAQENYIYAKDGGDPRQTNKLANVPTFKQAAYEVLENNCPSWTNTRYPDDWIKSLERHAMPKLGRLLVSEIELRHVESVLKPIWATKPVMAKDVRCRIGNIMLWSVAHKYRTDNPAAMELMNAILPKIKHRVVHLKALHYSQVQQAIEQIRAQDAQSGAKLCFEFLVLTASRSGEARGARWDEIDMDNAIWVVPANRMKARLEHRVPLNNRALHVLKQAHDLYGSHELIFPSIRHKRMQDAILSRLVRDAGVDSTVHGFRSSFRQWAAERTNIPREVAELALAHVNQDKTESAYQRSDLIEQRRKLMDAWASYLDAECAAVISLPDKKRYDVHNI